MRLVVAGVLLLAPMLGSDDNLTLGDRARQYLVDLIRQDTSNPPGNETKVAEYLKQIADAHGIPAELLGADPKRMSLVARLKGGRQRPLLLIAHSDVVPADRSQWTVDPFSGETRQGYIYGRGAQDDKSLLAAEMAVLVEIKRRRIRLNRDIILLSEADEEAGSTGIEWLIQHAYPKIDADSALNEGGFILGVSGGTKIFQVQTAEKIPTRIVLTAKGTAGHGSLPRPDNPILHLSRAIQRLSESEEPVRLNSTTRRYFRDISKLADYQWLQPLLPRLENPATAGAAANEIHKKDPELEAMLRTTVSPTMLHSGIKINVIPNTAEAQLDVRRMPSETREEVMARFRQIVNDPSVDIAFAPGQHMPSTEPSAMTMPLYHAMERTINKIYPHDLMVPYMSRGASDGSYLRGKGMAVYGVPLFVRDGESRAHGNDERISLKNLDDGVELLWQIVLEMAGTD